MLSEKSRPYIDASVPVLRDHGVTITRVFYQNLFAECPELTNLFNKANQASGAQQQSLAAAVFAYAANHDNVDALAPVISRIAHKHASLGIRADQYPLVGRHLLGAIKEVLGDAATPDLLAAWAEAYGILADALIAAEKNLYAERETEPGAFRSLRVREVVPQSELVIAFTLESTDGSPVWNFKPGQYISVAVDFVSGQRQLRQYSLSDAPGSETLRLSIKREVAGKESPAGQVSNWLHDNLKVGSTILATPPSGDFFPTRGDKPLVLLSAGVGITPMISALNAMAKTSPERSVIFAHATRNPQTHAHRADVASAQARMPHLQTITFYEFPDPVAVSEGVHEGFMSLSALPAWSYADTDVYLCGPLPFMRAQAKSLHAAGVPVSHIHREVFGPELLDHLA